MPISGAPARKGGILKAKINFYAFLFSPLLLGACITDEQVYSRLAPPPPSYGKIMDFRDQPAYAEAVALNRLAPALGSDPASLLEAASAQKLPVKNSFQKDCSIRDRFDRDLTLAYRFKDGRTQIGLDLKGDVYRGDFEGAKFALRFKLQPPGKRERINCLYDSPVQGLLGSAYNELFERDHNTVWDELDDAGLGF